MIINSLLQINSDGYILLSNCSNTELFLPEDEPITLFTAVSAILGPYIANVDTTGVGNISYRLV